MSGKQSYEQRQTCEGRMHMGENLSVRKVLRYGAVFLIFAAAACFLVLRGTDMRKIGKAHV